MSNIEKIKKNKSKKNKFKKNKSEKNKSEDDEFSEILNSSKNNREVFDKLRERGENIILIDHIITSEEMKKYGFGMSDKELMSALLDHADKDTLAEFLGGLIVDMYTKHARLNDLSLLDS